MKLTVQGQRIIHSSFRRVSAILQSNSLMTLGSSLALQAMVLVTGIISARALGAEGRGELAVVLVWANLLIALGDMGVQVGSAKAIASCEINSRTALRFGLLATLAASPVLILIAGVLVRSFVDPHLQSLAFTFALVTIPLSMIRLCLLGILRGNERYLLFNLCRLALVVPYLIVLTVLVWLDRMTVAAVTGATIANLVVALAVAVLATRPLIKDEPIQWSSLRGFARYAAVVHLGTLPSSDTLRIDLILVTLVMSTYHIGLYTAASSLMFLPRLIGQSVGIVALTEQASATTQHRTILVLKRYRQTAALTVLSVILLAGASEFIMTTAFGEEFEGSGLTTALLIVTGGIVSIRRVLADCLRGLDLHRASTFHELLALGGYLLFFYPLATAIGLEGAAIALLIANVMALVLTAETTKRQLGLNWGSLLPSVGDLRLHTS